jgi:hypothetical protein
MSCTDISKHDREEVNSLIYNFIAEREEFKEVGREGEVNLGQKLI